MTKKELRSIYKDKRRDLSLPDIEKANDLILINFQKITLPFINCVHTYLASSTLGEADTGNILRYLEFQNPDLKIVAPSIDLTTNTMKHFCIDDETHFVINSYGIEEPVSGKIVDVEEIDLVLLPLLAFDKAGFRVGYGKGFYDRFLKECKPETIKIGLSFFKAVDEISDIDSFDVPMNYCVTPSRIFSFTK